MVKQRKVLARLLSVIFTITMLFGSLNMVPEVPVYAAATNAPANLSIGETDAGLTLKWGEYNGAAAYDVYRAASRYGEYVKVTTVNGLSWTDNNANADKYANYYKVAVAGSNDLSDPMSLEIEMFGEDMYVFSPNDDVEQVYNAINDVYLVQGDVKDGTANAGQQFGPGRYTFAFKTGDYSNMQADHINMSYYMQLIGLGKLPTDVKLRNVHVPPVLPSNNVTCNFWMGIENLSIAPVGIDTNDAYFDFQWAVSQAAPARRLYVDRGMRLNYMWDGWASGGYVADSVITGNLGSWSQQQYYLRNNDVKGDFYGINWNLVAQGNIGMKGSEWNGTVAKFPMYDLESGLGTTNWESGGKYTVLNTTDALREKPFLYFDEDVKEYKVFVPGMRTDSKGTSWSAYSMGKGESLDISEFYIARADRDNAATINAALDAGKNIILSPGIYYAEEPIEINNANTVFLGLGLATIIPDNAETGVKIADVDGVTFAGVILDADSTSETMIVVGTEGSTKDHSANPTILQDVFVRVGGVHGGVASTESAMVINSNDVIGDHFWIWRADHGDGVGWGLNKAANGVVVNGDDVTLYGLMVEHFQEYDVLWRGENGTTYFLQNEMAYDPQAQDGWMSHEGTVKGYASYKVANNVDNHYAVGLGVYDVFINTNGASIFADNAIEVPNKEGVLVENACIVEIANGEGPIVGINSIVNGTGFGITTGTGSGGGYARQALLSYENGKALVLDDYYKTGGNEAGIVLEQTGAQPTDDPKAEKEIVKVPEDTQDPQPQPGDENEVATGPYADWKNGAITTPARGQLMAAGTYEIKFGKLDGATKYEVFVDGANVKTIEGNDANAADFAVEAYSVDVNSHKVYVKATLENGSEIYSNTRTYYISKKGMGIWQSASDKIAASNLSWYYTWSPTELTGVSDEVEFVPMIWGDEADNRSGDRDAEWAWLRSGKANEYTHLLSFNEPDFTDQSNMTPERAVELWPELEAVSDGGVKVSSPAVAIPTVFYTDANNDYGTVGGWYGKYEQLMASAQFHDDFTAVHFYFDYPGDYVLDILKDIHDVTGKPIWITEWGVGQWTQVQPFDWTGGPDEGNWQRDLIVEFMESAIPKLDQMDFVERYAWFPFDGSNTEKYGNGAGGLFFNGGTGDMTAAGKAYARLGNPEGYDANVKPGDKVQEDKIVETPPVDPKPPVDPEPPVISGENILVGKTATASTELGGNVAANAIDANAGSRWETIHDASGDQWIMIDLGGTYKMDSFKVVWETAAAKDYKFQVSSDGQNWDTYKHITNGENGQTREEVLDSVAEGNYVRFLCHEKTTGYGYSIFEWEVYGVKTGDGNNGGGNEGGNTNPPSDDLTDTYNIVSGKTASASTEMGGNVAANAIDANAGSRWETIHNATGEEWIMVDLGGTYKMDSFKVVWETAAAEDYKFQVSSDGQNWDTFKHITDGVNGQTREEKLDGVAEGNYVRILCNKKTTGYGYSIFELEVYGAASDGSAGSGSGDNGSGDDNVIIGEKVNVVSGKTASASTVFGGNTAANAIDANGGSRWETIHDATGDEWLMVDLGDTYKIDSFKIVWETAAAKDYEFQVSADGKEWKTVKHITNGENGQTREESFSAVDASYIRILCNEKTTIYGYSIFELEVMGVK